MGGIHIIFLVLLLISLGLAAFFCSAEIAFIGIQKLRLQNLIEKGNPRAKIVAKIMERPEKFLATVLLGINLFETLAATMGTIIAVSLWGENLGAALATVIITLVTLVAAEYIPKSLAARHGEKIALSYAQPIVFISTISYPLVYLLNRVGIKLSSLPEGSNPEPTVSEEELHTMITVGHREGTVEKEAAEMLHNVFEFGDRPVSEVMIRRPEVIFIENGARLSDFLNLYAENPLSQFPVYKENRDNVVGILLIKDVLMAQAKGNINDKSSMDELIRPAYFTPENKPISKLFTEMRDNNQHIAVVVDEFGGTVGVVSINKLIEVIVGPMGDEMAGEEKDFEVINDYTFQIDGSMRVEEANEEMELGLPEGNYKTVAGFILHLLQRIPRLGENLRYKDLKLVITKMHGVKIEEVLVTREKSVQGHLRNTQKKEPEKTDSSS
ncbi:MAG: hemolysin [Chloroflexi bacterium RBG_16_56_11]|nr:MAG: hemolysin [Chloroflexi bacterium RBG_16_56_11]